jgi:exodeoxyribonuclease V beta subunit
MASRLQDAPDGELAGTSTGSLDLVRCVDGDWFIYDYKSNDLGRNPAMYSAQSDASGLSPVDHAMVRNHYPLQAALYAAMLRRWLRSRGRRHDRVAGVAYLFVRGMDASVPGQGVWHWRPGEAILDAVDRHLVQAGVIA